MRIKDKVAVITGAASGIGQAVSTLLAERGAKKIAVVDMTDRLEEVDAAINAEAGRDVAVPFQGNVTDAGFRQSVYVRMVKDYDLVSICVPAAGITRDDLAVRVNKESGKATICPQENFDLVVNVNLIAPVYWAMELIARIAEDRATKGKKKWVADEDVQGTVIFIGSISSQGNKGWVSYASTDKKRPRCARPFH